MKWIHDYEYNSWSWLIIIIIFSGSITFGHKCWSKEFYSSKFRTGLFVIFSLFCLSSTWETDGFLVLILSSDLILLPTGWFVTQPQNEQKNARRCIHEVIMPLLLGTCVFFFLTFHIHLYDIRHPLQSFPQARLISNLLWCCQNANQPTNATVPTFKRLTYYTHARARTDSVRSSKSARGEKNKIDHSFEPS